MCIIIFTFRVIFKVLVEELGADVNAREEHGASLMYVAASRNEVDTIYLLDELEADINLPTFDGATPAYIAAFYGFVDVLRALDDIKADINKPMNDGATPAFIAAASGQVEALRILKQIGADLDKPTKDGATPAFIAAQEGQVESLHVLGELGADLNAADDDSATPACIAAQEGQTAVLTALGALGADLNAATVDGATPACIAAKVGRVSVVRILGTLGADLDKPNRKGVGPIHIAAFCGNAFALRALNDSSANLDAREEHGATPMFIAAANNQVFSINTLFALGASLETPTFDGITPAHIASANGQTAALRAMLSLGCPIDTKTRDGATPALLAAKNGNVETLELLLAHGASVPDDISAFVERFSFSGTVCALLTEEKKQELREKYLSDMPLHMWTSRDLRDHLLDNFGKKNGAGSMNGFGLKRSESTTASALSLTPGLSSSGSSTDADSLLRDLLGDGKSANAMQDTDATDELANVPHGRAVVSVLLKCSDSDKEDAWDPFEQLLRPVLGDSLTDDEMREGRAARRAAVRAHALAERRAVRGLSDDEDEEDDRFEGDASDNFGDDDLDAEEEEDDDEMAEREAFEQPWLNFSRIAPDLLRRTANSLMSLVHKAPMPLRSAFRFGAALRDGAILRRPQAPPAMSAAKPVVQFDTYRAEPYAFSDRHVVLVLAAPPPAATTRVASDTPQGLARAASVRIPNLRSSASFRGTSFRSASFREKGEADVSQNRSLSDDHVLVCCVDIQTVFAHGKKCATPGSKSSREQLVANAVGSVAASGTTVAPETAAVGALANDVFWASLEDLTFPARVSDEISKGAAEQIAEDTALSELAAAVEAAIGASDWATAELLLALAANLVVRPWWREWARKRSVSDDPNEASDDSGDEGSGTGIAGGSGAVARSEGNSRGRQRSGGLGALARCLPLALASSNCPPLQWAALRVTATLLRFADQPPTTSAFAALAVAAATAAVGALELGLNKLRPGVPTHLGSFRANDDTDNSSSGSSISGQDTNEASPLVTWASALVRSPTVGRQELVAAMAPLEPVGQVYIDGPCDALTPVLVAAIRAALRASISSSSSSSSSNGRGLDPLQAVRDLIFSSPGSMASSSGGGSSGALPFGTCRLATVLAAWLGESPTGPGGAITSPAAMYALRSSGNGRNGGSAATAGTRRNGSTSAADSAQAAASAVLLSVWEQALANRPDLPVAHFFLLLPPPPSSLEANGSGSSSGEGGGGLYPLLEGVCARVLADPWWRGSSNTSNNSIQLRFHAAAWRALREATGAPDNEPSELRSLCGGESALRDSLQVNSVFAAPVAVATNAAVKGSSLEESSSSSSVITAMPLPSPPLPPRQLSVEEELEDEEARWMAGERLDPNKETAETRTCRKALGRSLLHALDALRLREALLPSRNTPGLWAGLDGYGVGAADAVLLQLKRDMQEVVATVEPLLTHACAQHLTGVLDHMRPQSSTDSSLISSSGSGSFALLDAATCRSDFEASLDAWLRGGARKTLASVLVAQSNAVAEGASGASVHLEAAMEKLWTVAASAAKFLARLPGQAVTGSSGDGPDDGANALVLRRITLDALALDVTSPNLFDPESEDSKKSGGYSRDLTAAALQPPSLAKRLLADALTRLPVDLDANNTDDNGNSGAVASATVAASAAGNRFSGAQGGDPVEAYYQSLEAEKSTTLQTLSSAVGLVATDAASGASFKLSSLLSRVLQELTLAVAAARSVLEAIRGLDQRNLPSALKETQVMRRRALTLLVRWANGKAAQKLFPNAAPAAEERATAAAKAGSLLAHSKNNSSAPSIHDPEVAVLVALAPRFSFEALAAHMFPTLAPLANTTTPLDETLFRRNEHKLAAAITASLLPRNHSTAGIGTAGAASEKEPSSSSSGGGGLSRLKAASRKLSTARGVASAFDASALDGKSRSLNSLEAIGAAITDLAHVPPPGFAPANAHGTAGAGSEGSASGTGANATSSSSSGGGASAWTAALAWLCASLIDAWPTADPSSPSSPSPPLPPPQLLPGAFHATCLALGGSSSSNGSHSQAPNSATTSGAGLPEWALFRVRRPLQLQDLQGHNSHHHRGSSSGNSSNSDPSGDNSSGGCGPGHSFLVVCFRGCDYGGAAGNPDWLSDLFEGKDEPCTLSGLGDVWGSSHVDDEDIHGSRSAASGESEANLTAARDVWGNAADRLLDVSLHGPWLTKLAQELPHLMSAIQDAHYGFMEASRLEAQNDEGDDGDVQNDNDAESVWCTGHGLGGAYAQLFQLLLRAGCREMHGDESGNSRGRNQAGDRRNGRRRNDDTGSWALACAEARCAVYGAPQVVYSDPLECVAPLFMPSVDNSASSASSSAEATANSSSIGVGPSPLQSFVFGHDLVPRLLASPPKPPGQLTAAEALQLRRIGKYSPRFHELVKPGGAAYLPLGAFVFLQPSFNRSAGTSRAAAVAAKGSTTGGGEGRGASAVEVVASRPLEQWSVEPRQSHVGTQLLRRLSVEWGVLPLAPRLHDCRSRYAHALRTACGLEAPPRQLPAGYAPPTGERTLQHRSSRGDPQPQPSHSNAPATVSPGSTSSLSSRGSGRSSGDRSSGNSNRGARRDSPPSAAALAASAAMAATAVSPHSSDLLRRSGSGNGSFSEREQRQAAHARSSPGSSRGSQHRSNSGSRSGGPCDQGHGSVNDNDDDEEDADEPSASNLTVFLTLAKLSQHEATLREEGYEEVDDLADADDSDLLRAGFKKPEIRRLRRYLSEHE